MSELPMFDDLVNALERIAELERALRKVRNDLQCVSTPKAVGLSMSEVDTLRVLYTCIAVIDDALLDTRH